MYNNNIIGLVIPTRFKSERLPGKVLMNIAGKKQIEWMIERALRCKYLDKIILAISEEDSFEILKWFSKDIFFAFGGESVKKVSIFLDSHNDLMARTLGAIRKFNIDMVVSVSHDCTFIDPWLMNILIERLLQYGADYSSNCITRSFPDGFDLQVHTKEIYEKIEAIIPKNHPTRMWTAWNIFHWREKIFPKPKIINYESSPEYFYPEIHLALDTEQDKKNIEFILNFFQEFGNKYPSHKEIIDYIFRCELLPISSFLKTRPTELLQEDL